MAFTAAMVFGFTSLIGWLRQPPVDDGEESVPPPQPQQLPHYSPLPMLLMRFIVPLMLLWSNITCQTLMC